MVKLRRSLFSLALIALVGIMAGQARAGTLTMVVSVGSDEFPITPGNPFAQAGSTNTALTVNTDALNAALAAVTDLRFSDLGATSNNPGAADGAKLSQTGTAFLAAGVSGSSSIRIDTYIADYTSPTGNNGTLMSSSTALFSNATAGDNQTFRSWFNPDNSVPATPPPPGPGFIVPSPLLTFTTTGLVQDPFSGSAANTPVGTVAPPYSLTNEIVLTLTGSASQSAQDQFAGTTLLTANVIPEPASIVMFMTGMPLPLVVVGLLRRRRRALAQG